MPNVCFPIRKETFERTNSVTQGLFSRYVSCAARKRKKLPVSDFVAL